MSVYSTPARPVGRLADGFLLRHAARRRHADAATSARSKVEADFGRTGCRFHSLSFSRPFPVSRHYSNPVSPFLRFPSSLFLLPLSPAIGGLGKHYIRSTECPVKKNDSQLQKLQATKIHSVDHDLQSWRGRVTVGWLAAPTVDAHRGVTVITAAVHRCSVRGPRRRHCAGFLGGLLAASFSRFPVNPSSECDRAADTPEFRGDVDPPRQRRL